MPTFLRRLRARIKYWNHDRDLKREIEAHRDLAARDISGDTGDREARARAMKQLGNTTLAREDARAVWMARWIEQLVQDIRYAFRGLQRTPWGTLAALAVLVAAIGLNTSLFTAFNAVLLRPWPVAKPAEVVSAFAARGTSSIVYGGWPLAEYRYLRAHATRVDLVAMRDDRVTFDYQPAGVGSAVRIASDNYFSTLGVPIQLGRGFAPGDDDLEHPRAVVVLSDRTWREGYGGRASLVGESILIDNVPFMVIGIAGPGALDNPLDPFPSAWLPWTSLLLRGGTKSSLDTLTSPTACCQDIAGRLHAGETARAAEVELTGLSQQFRGANQARFVGVRVTGTALLDTPRANTATPIFGLLFAGVLLLLALACANVGNLVLARSMSRTNEVRVRLSLGAARSRIVRQFLTESVVLAALAALVSVPIAYWLPAQILGGVSPLVAFGLDLRPDPMVFGFVALLVVLSALFFGLAPALRVTRSASRLATGSRQSADRGTARLRLGLLAGQIAISGVLIVASVLLGRAVLQVSAAPLGFDPAGLDVATVWLPANAYNNERADALSRDLLTSGAVDTRVVAAAASAPFAAKPTIRVRRPGRPDDEAIETTWETVSPTFLDVIGIGGSAGRPITGPLAANEAVVNERLADALGGDAIGRSLQTATGQAFIVVAVVRDARLAMVDSDVPTVFRIGVADHAPDLPARTLTFVARGPDAVASLERAISAIDPRVRVTTRAVTDYMGDQLKPSQMGAAIAGALGAIAAVVSAIGIFGVVMYIVSAREREIGIRLALGASRRAVVRTIVRGTVWALGTGLAAGLLIALVLVPALGSYLFGMSPFDPAAFLMAGAVLVVAGGLATLVPLMRAMRVDPAATLRQE